jgi:hypothetical protein
MASLPCVVSLTRERIARELDDRGPDVCRTEVIQDLEANNPELLDMASRCARDVGDYQRIMMGFCIFYRLLGAQARADLAAAERAADRRQLSLIPRVSPQTRAAMVKRIDALGSHEFTSETIAELERNNPELLLMGHNFAADQRDYLGVMQGFALLYASLLAEAAQERSSMH